MVQVPIWLCTFPDVRKVYTRSDGKQKQGSDRFYLNRSALTADVVEALSAAGVAELWADAGKVLPEAAIVGAARVELVDAYHHLQLLSPAERSQYNLWKKHLGSGSDLSGRLFRFRIHDHVRLAVPELLQRCGSQRGRGFALELEMGQPERLLANLGGMAPAWLQGDGDTCHIALRLCSPYAVLAAAGAWASLLVPDLPGLRGRWAIGWRMLGIARADLPALPGFACKLQRTTTTMSWLRMRHQRRWA